jgi:hypothetical protein
MLGIGDLVAARGAVAEAAATTLLGLLLDDVDDVDGDGVELLCGLTLAFTDHRAASFFWGQNEQKMVA